MIEDLTKSIDKFHRDIIAPLVVLFSQRPEIRKEYRKLFHGLSEEQKQNIIEAIKDPEKFFKENPPLEKEELQDRVDKQEEEIKKIKEQLKLK